MTARVRNDERGFNTPAPSLRGTKQSMRLWTERIDCHGAARLAMTGLARSDERGFNTPAPSLRGTKQSMRRLIERIDCHGAARLAMTGRVRQTVLARIDGARTH
jgi:hypothetical protein